MAEEELTLGQYFKQERENRGLDLKEIEERTKISAQMLAFLEADEMEALPPKAFLRGFLQVIAREFDMDVEELLVRLETALAAHEQSQPAPEGLQSPDQGRLLRWLVLGVIALVVAVSVALCVPRDETPEQEPAQVSQRLCSEGDLPV